MNTEVYVEAALVETQRDRFVGGIGFIALDDSACIKNENWEYFGYTSNRLELELSALAFGLKHASDGDIIYSSSDYCVDGFNDWLAGWKRRDWRKANKKPITNEDLWRLVDKLSANKHIEVRKADNRSAGKHAAYRYALAAANRQL
ncbi:RNase H family protein [Pseudoalteromonas sp. TAE56]|uniref:RNase H family protein n=1 Tax=Pseudoalteromonas sp. TAE56 TaxID=1938596 RepID=UPI00041391F3|nr:RNase H family protein [Pseudoalteromonas sp. TAE56]